MSEWQPIETARKDGTEILGWDGACRFTCRWDPPAYGLPGRWRLVESGRGAEEDDVGPTHWQPLPDPPK